MKKMKVRASSQKLIKQKIQASSEIDSILDDINKASDILESARETGNTSYAWRLVDFLHDTDLFYSVASQLDNINMSDIDSSTQVTASDEEDDNWEFDPYAGGTYRVMWGYGKSKNTNNPKTAISYWYQKQQDNPGDVSIMCKTREDAVRLCKAATQDYILQLTDKYGCPYKADYIIEEAEKAVNNGCKYFYEDSYGYGDSVHPFSVG